MKRWIIIGLSILLLAFLAFNAIREKIQDDKQEWRGYIEQLHFDFSGEIDSMTVINDNFGFFRFHLTRGNVDRLQQIKVNRQQKNKDLWLLGFSDDDKIQMVSRRPKLYLAGDSLCVNTDKNEVVVYRNGKEISRGSVLAAVRSRRF